MSYPEILGLEFELEFFMGLFEISIHSVGHKKWRATVANKISSEQRTEGQNYQILSKDTFSSTK